MKTYMVLSILLFIVVIILLVYIIWKDMKEDDQVLSVLQNGEYCGEGCNCFSNCKETKTCCDQKCGDAPGECNCDKDCLQWGNCCDECDGMRFVCKRK